MSDSKTMPEKRPPRPNTGRKNAPNIAPKVVSRIGTAKESSLHRALKFRYSGSDGETETLEGNYVCDGRTGKGELIEVQLGSLGPLRGKIESLTARNKVRIIHPIFAEKIIELYDNEGRLLHRRKSPKKGNLWDFFKALVYAPELPLKKNLSIELALIGVTEKRVDDGSGSWRRKGARISDRVLDSWRDSVVLGKLPDYRRFIPFEKSETFTAGDFSKKAKITEALARKAVYTLTKMGLIEKTGKKGRSFLYIQK